ncbi:hypothetical protein FOZ62_008396, partial [Perkinsus olseni]
YKVKLSVDDTVELETLIQLATECTDSKLPAACEFTRARKRSMLEELHAFGDTIEETARNMKAEILDPDGGFIVEAGGGWSSADSILGQLGKMKASAVKLEQQMKWACESEKCIDTHAGGPSMMSSESQLRFTEAPVLAQLIEGAEGVWSEISLWHKLVSKWREERVETCDIGAWKDACSARAAPAQTELQATSKSRLMGGGLMSTQGPNEVERYRPLYEALVQDILE